VRHPRKFAKGLRQIQATSFTVEEVIALEACFEGRSISSFTEDIRVSSLDDSNDPDGAIGLNAVLHFLHQDFSSVSQATREVSLVS
ncbi:MAG: hypothetical protein AAFV07_12260, partial [Bacteroidota bacterium]